MMYNCCRILALARHDRTPWLVAVSIYLLSFLLPAGSPSDSAEKSYLGGLLFINGISWICGCFPLSVAEALWKGNGKEVGRLFYDLLVNWSAWLANPLFWCAVWQYCEGRRIRATILAGAAVMLAGLFFCSAWMWQQHIWQFPAYYFWIASPAVLAVFGVMRRGSRPTPSHGEAP